MAILLALNKFRDYLIGRKFTIYTEHRAVVCLFTQKAVNSMMERWYETLIAFDLEVVHVAGAENRLADALCRKSSAVSLIVLTTTQIIRGKKAPAGKGDIRSLVERAHQFGHFGEDEVFKKFRHDGYWWDGMRKDI